jgi:hypothetical protein
VAHTKVAVASDRRVSVPRRRRAGWPRALARSLAHLPTGSQDVMDMVKHADGFAEVGRHF